MQKLGIPCCFDTKEEPKPRLKASDSSLHEQRPSNSSGLAENLTVSKKALRAYFLYNVYLFLWPQVSSILSHNTLPI